MSYIISQRIKELRVERGLSQEYVANELSMTRQRFARIESNQVQITYRTIEQIADVFGVSINEITRPYEEKKTLRVLFRESNDKNVSDEAIEKVQTILEYMSAHEKLYYKMKERENNED